MNVDHVLFYKRAQILSWLCLEFLPRYKWVDQIFGSCQQLEHLHTKLFVRTKKNVLFFAHNPSLFSRRAIFAVGALFCFPRSPLEFRASRSRAKSLQLYRSLPFVLRRTFKLVRANNESWNTLAQPRHFHNNQAPHSLKYQLDRR